MSSQKISLLPWVHDLRSNEHREIIQYISQLKQGSFVALETRPDNYFEFNAIAEVLLGKNITLGHDDEESRRILEEIYEHPLDILEHLDTEGLSFFETVLVCREKGLIVIPIEDVEKHDNVIYNGGLKRGKDGKFSSLDLDMVDEITINREVEFLARILDALPRLNGNGLRVITGLGHTLSLKDLLGSKGYNVEIDVTPFSDKTKMWKMIHFSAEQMKEMRLLRRLISEQNILAASVARQKLDILEKELDELVDNTLLDRDKVISEIARKIHEAARSTGNHRVLDMFRRTESSKAYRPKHIKLFGKPK